MTAVKVVNLSRLLSSGVITPMTTFISEMHFHGEPNRKQVRIYSIEATNDIFFVEENPDYVYLKHPSYPAIHYLIRMNDQEEDETEDRIVALVARSQLERSNRFDVFFADPKPLRSLFDLSEATLFLEQLNQDFLQPLNRRLVLEHFYNIPAGPPVRIVGSYGREFQYPILCLYEGDTCISSITLVTSQGDEEVEIDAYTMPAFEKQKLNILMLATAILIAKKINPYATTLISTGVNPTSAYIMLHYFHAHPTEDEEEIFAITGTDPSKITFSKVDAAFEAMDEKIVTAVNLEDPATIVLAQKVFLEAARFMRERRVSKNGGFSRCRKNTPCKHKTRQRRKKQQRHATTTKTSRHSRH